MNRRATRYAAELTIAELVERREHFEAKAKPSDADERHLRDIASAIQEKMRDARKAG